ncbi:MAG TPA: BTAD domain-containing putative transcriptional regulator [Solirubrobacteraceae bacterium]
MTAHRAGVPLPVGGPVARAVLGVLALRAGELVSVAALQEAIGADADTPGAANRIQVVVSRLRRALGAEGPALLVTAPPGYRLATRPEQVDWLRFTAAATHGREAVAAGRAAQAVRLLDEALALWRGPVLVDVADRVQLPAEIAALEEARLLALEARIEARLALGAHDELPAELSALIREHPWRERLYGLQMTALYRCGRQADALETYRRAAQTLRDDLGLEPEPALRELEHAILTHDPVLWSAAPHEAAPPRATGARPPAAAAVPAALARVEAVGFVGRGSELAALRDAWRRAQERDVRLAVLLGEAGMGKTSLAARFAHEPAAAGARVLYGRCDEETVVPYQPFAEALRDARAWPGWAEEAEAEAALAALLGDGDAGEPDSTPRRHRFFEVLVGLVADAARDEGLLLVLDDLHWADEATILLLRHLLRRAVDVPLMVLGCCRPDELAADHPTRRLLRALGHDPLLETIAIAGLDDADVAALVARRAGSGTAASFVGRLRTMTGGNPLFVDETVRALGERLAGAPDDALLAEIGVPDGVREVIGQRLAQLDPRTRAPLFTAAAAGPAFRLDVLCHLFGADEATEALAEAHRAGLLAAASDESGRGTFAHELIRETLYQSQIPAARMRAHQRLGEAMEELGITTADAELAHHFYLARHLGSHDKAFEHLLAAAAQASRATAHESAAEHCRKALVVLGEWRPEDLRLRHEVVLRLAHEVEHAGDFAEAREHFAAAADLARGIGEPELFARSALGFARWARYGVEDTQAIELLEEALERLGPAPTALRAGLLARLARRMNTPVDAGRRERQLRLLEDSFTIARETGDAETLAQTLCVAPDVMGGPDEVEARLRLGREGVRVAEDLPGGAELAARAHEHCFRALLELGSTDAAASHLDAYEALAAEINEPWIRWQALNLRCTLATLAGRLDAVEALIARSRAIELEHDPEALETFALQRFALAKARAEPQRADTADLEECARRHPDALLWRAVVANRLAAAGEAGDAAERLRSVLSGIDELPRDDDWLAALCLAAETASIIGAADGGCELYARLSPYAHLSAASAQCHTAWGSVARYAAMAAAVSGSAEVEAHARRAVAGNAAAGAWLWMIHGACDAADALGDSLWDEAMALARRAGVADAAIALRERRRRASEVIRMTRTA